MIYKLNNTSQDPKPPHRHFRTGTLANVCINNEIISIDNLFSIMTRIIEDFEAVNYVDIDIKYYRHTYEPFPDFLTIDIKLKGVNSSVQNFLEKNNIKYSVKPINILNEKDKKYNLVTFPTRDLIHINASKGYIKSDGSIATVGKNYFDSEIILKEEAKNLQGIYRLDKLGNVLICDEKTKNELEKSGLTGIAFEKLKIVED